MAPCLGLLQSCKYRISDLLKLQVRTFLELHEMLLNLPVPAETRISWETFL